MGKALFARPEFVVACLMVFAGFFSIFFMLPQSIGLDEAQSLWQSAHTITGVIYVVAQDVHVPLYHYLLHFWQVFFGNSAAAARSLSLLFYLATIPLVYRLGALAFDERTALFGTALFALSPFTNWYGSIIRMYSMLAFFAVLSQYCFMLIYKGAPERRPAYWAGYFFSALLGMYTHYFFFFVLIAQAAFFFAYRKLFPKGALKDFLTVAAVLFVLFLPWLAYVRSLGGLGTNTSPKLIPPTTVDVSNTFSNFFFGFQIDAVNTIILSSWPIATLLIFLALQRNRRVTPEAMFFIMTTLVPILGAAVLSHFISPFYLSRYFIGVFPSCCLAASWFFFLYPRGASLIARTALVSLMIISLGIQTANRDVPIKEDYRTAAAYITSHATARDIVAISTPFTIYPLEYYYRGPAAMTTIPAWNRLISGPIPPYNTSTLQTNIAAFDKDHSRLWLVLSYDQGYQESIRTYFDTHFERTGVEHFSPGLDIYSYRLTYTTTTLATALSVARSVLQ